jgi:hypothetical protein
VTPEEFAYLEVVPDPAFGVEETVDCEYETGHAGPHVNAAQAGDDGWDLPELLWWLHWSDTERRIVRLSSAERCNEVGRHPNDAPEEAPWSCEFVAGHPGVHKWQMEGFNLPISSS